ncbi:MAG: GtrA family protein, partial [Beijerinckiaceae bacterium]
MTLTVLYALFATIAIAVNIGAQDIVLRVYGGAYAVALSIFAGTLAGLVVKYVLDKRLIFKFQAHDLRHDGALFLRYSLMGVVTTLIFWGFEMG